MSYRDDHEALRSYHDTLVRELTRLEDRTAELATVEADRARVARELARVRGDLDQQRARRSPIRLDNLRVASPCKESWDRMTGDDRVRDCARCDKQVFNLSTMTSDEAEELLASRGITACVRFFRRADGTVMTADCPVGAKKQRRKLAIAAGVIAAAAGGGVIAATLDDDDDDTRPHVQELGGAMPVNYEVGRIAMPDPGDGSGMEMIQGGVSAPPVDPGPPPHARPHKKPHKRAPIKNR